VCTANPEQKFWRSSHAKKNKASFQILKFLKVDFPDKFYNNFNQAWMTLKQGRLHISNVKPAVHVQAD